MRSTIRLACALALCATTALGCAAQPETPIQRAQRLEPLLSAAGFHMHPADTPARQNQLHTLTPLKVRFYPYNGKMHYWFADPDYCNCIFAGNATAYDTYQREKLQQQMANQQELSAQMNEDAAQQENMNFMAWPPDPFFY
ncbi:MAG TPA: hypothetical protein VND20_09550 [Candidatus Binataceae bacterium]|nr:hypothetical protein [Candidatus Binataceae bacterium]